MHRRIGQWLQEIVPLSTHDVEDILQEQKSTRQRFGDVALSLGLVRPEHVWKAWIRQIESETTEVDLQEVGIDAQVVNLLPRQVVHQHRVLPIRTSGEEVVIACETIPTEQTQRLIRQFLPQRAVFIRARSGQLDQAIHRYHPPTRYRTEAA
ncbi:MAG: hypothetical protein KatS3mg104_1081 [Phycisphaerae bacterium]|jgi:hypothetical protein|nr:MAG: hypothetical protein KatS3mg104_1081 [Phycisphaerae bacterium]